MTDSTRLSSHMTGGTGEASAGVGWPGLAPQKIGIWITKELQFIWSQWMSIADTFGCVFRQFVSVCVHLGVAEIGINMN